jgi:Fic family protein
MTRLGDNIPSPQLRKKNQIKTIHSSLAIEHNSLSIKQMTDIIDGKRVLGAPDEIQEVKNAVEAYRLMSELDAFKEKDLLRAHELMMKDLVRNSGHYRQEGVGVFDGNGNCLHMAPPAERVPQLMGDLFEWVNYSVIQKSDQVGDSTLFVEFMLRCLLNAMDNYEVEEESEVQDKVQDKMQDKFPEVSKPTWDVFDIIHQNPKATVNALCEQLGLKERQIYKHISVLKSLGLIVRVGSNKTGYWKVNI